jgi:hypothetical protein
MAAGLAAVFDKQIEIDLKWRENELLSLKLSYALATNANTRTALLRALICLLYSHYEGYCKYLFDLWCEFFTRRCERIDDLKPPLQYLALQRLAAKLPTLADGTQIVLGIDEIMAARAAGARIGTPLSTSNLWAEILEKALGAISLSSEVVSDQRRRIDLLLSRRNDVAHGKMTTFSTLEAYQEYEDAIFLVMVDVALTLSSSLDLRTYLI